MRFRRAAFVLAAPIVLVAAAVLTTAASSSSTAPPVGSGKQTKTHSVCADGRHSAGQLVAGAETHRGLTERVASR